MKWNDIIRRVLGDTSGNFAEFPDSGRIKNSNISIKNIKDKIEKSVAHWLKTTGDTMTGELSLGGNKITVLRNPTSAKDVANKQYVDAGDATVDNKLTTSRTEYDAHVNQFVRLRRNYQKTDQAVEKFFGNPLTVDMKLTDIKTSLSDINIRLGVINDKKSFSDLIEGLQTNIAGITTLLDVVIAGIPQIVTKTNLIIISSGVAPENIVNISYVVSAGNGTWSQQINTIRYTASTTGIYRLSVLSSAKFWIFTIYPWRHDTDKFIGSVMVGLNSGTDETFILEAVDKKLTETTY